MKEHPVSRIMYPESRTTHPVSRSPENVYLNGAILGLGKKEIDAQFEEIVDFAEIGEFIDALVHVHASGMWQCERA